MPSGDLSPSTPLLYITVSNSERRRAAISLAEREGAVTDWLVTYLQALGLAVRGEDGHLHSVRDETGLPWFTPPPVKPRARRGVAAARS